ncbi:MAG: hypothetical protein IJ880_04645 [Bacilli bacterium]|nr:hypothetical protein [Bacilli bacterium]MBR3119712.1 hypothetical protein [Oceanobacillus sp.]
MNQGNGMLVSEFTVGDKVVLANPYLTVGSENKQGDTYTIVKTTLSFGEWKSAINDRTGRGYVMGDGEYRLRD